MAVFAIDGVALLLVHDVEVTLSLLVTVSKCKNRENGSRTRNVTTSRRSRNILHSDLFLTRVVHIHTFTETGE